MTDIKPLRLDIQEQAKLAWMNVPKWPSQYTNPFDYESYTKYRENPAHELVKIFKDPSYIYWTCKHIFNFEPFIHQLVILDTFVRKNFIILVAARGGTKSSIMAQYCLLQMVLEPGTKIAIVGAGLRQARNIHDYMTGIWQNAPVLRSMCKGKEQGPKRALDRFEFRVNDSICNALPLGTGDKIRGIRANTIIADEFASISPSVFNEVVLPFGAVAGDPGAKVRDTAEVEFLKNKNMWSEELEDLYDSLSAKNKIIRSGTTSYQFNHFYQTYNTYKTFIQSKGDLNYIKSQLPETQFEPTFNWKDYAIIRIPYNHLPKGLQDEKIVSEARSTLNKSQFGMEFGCIWLRDSDGFFKRSVLEAATTNTPITVPSGEKVQFSVSRQGSPEHRYILAVDPAAERDYAAMIVLELHGDHRRIVYSWSINRKKFDKIRKYREKRNLGGENDYYRYLGYKVKSIMQNFRIERIVVDQGGGGRALGETLKATNLLPKSDRPGDAAEEYSVYEIIDPDKEGADDHRDGLHILEYYKPTNERNSEMNHALLKDFETKTLLFPMYDLIELEKAAQIDKSELTEDYDTFITNEDMKIDFDSYENAVNEIDELKREIESIVVTKTVTNGERFDVPKLKMPGHEEKAFRKDRYSALLYANWCARNLDKSGFARHVNYSPVGMRAGRLTSANVAHGLAYTGRKGSMIPSSMAGVYKGSRRSN